VSNLIRFSLVSLAFWRVRSVVRRGSSEEPLRVFYHTGAAWPRRAAPPCHHARPSEVFRPSSGQSEDTPGCASLRGAQWCSPRGRGPHRRRDLLVGGTLPLGHIDQWGQRPTVSRRGTALGVDLGVFSVFDPGFELIFRK